MEMYIDFDIYYKKKSVFNDVIFNNLSPLSDPNEKNFDERIKATIEKIRNEKRVISYKFEMLYKTYEYALIDPKIKTIDDMHHRISFVTGSDGYDFAMDFSYFLLSYSSVSIVEARVEDDEMNLSGDDKNETPVLRISKNEIWPGGFI